jgi:hypothetical protein
MFCNGIMAVCYDRHFQHVEMYTGKKQRFYIKHMIHGNIKGKVGLSYKISWQMFNILIQFCIYYRCP